MKPKEVDCSFSLDGAHANQKDLVSGKELAAFLGVDERTVRRWAEKGLLRPFKIEGTVRYSRNQTLRTMQREEGSGGRDPAMG